MMLANVISLVVIAVGAFPRRSLLFRTRNRATSISTERSREKFSKTICRDRVRWRAS